MKRTAAIAVLAVALAVPASLPASASGRTSYATYLCAYKKRFPPLGRIYMALSVSPKGVGRTLCRAFNRGWDGKRIRHFHQLGTGTEYCTYSKTTAAATVVAAIFADRASTGKAFCTIWHPRGFHRIR